MAELLFGVLPPAEVLARVLLAMLLGGALGLERERKHRPAGLRTYMIVCMSSALVMLTGEYVFRLYGSGDPTRLAAQVISGIGFLGAGTIITTSRHVVGLTTAAALWASACIGLACGAGFYAGAVVCGVLVILVMTVLHFLDQKVFSHGNALHMMAVFDSVGDFYSFTNAIQGRGYRLFNIEFLDGTGRGGTPLLANVDVRLPSDRSDREAAVAWLKSNEYVRCLERVERF